MRRRKIRNPNNNIIAHPFEDYFRPPAPGVIDLTRTQPPTCVTNTPAIRQLPPSLAAPHARVVNNAPVHHSPVPNTRPYVRAVNNAPPQNASPHGRVVNNAPHNAPQVGVVHNAPVQHTRPYARAVNNAPPQNPSPRVTVVNNLLHNAPHARLIHNTQVQNTRPNALAMNHPLQNVPQQLQNVLARFHQAVNANHPNPYTLPLWGAPKPRQALKWTDLEDTFLQSVIHQAQVPWRYIMNVLPHRSRSAILQRMSTLKALTRNVRQELDLVLSRDEVEIIVIDGDDEAQAGGDTVARGGSADDGVGTGNAQGVPNSGDEVTAGADNGDKRAGAADDADDAQRVQDDGTRLAQSGETDGGEARVNSRAGGEDTTTDGEGGSEERQDSGQVENKEKTSALVATGDDIRVICERAVNVEHVPEDGKGNEGDETSDEECGLVGAQRVKAVLNEESDDEKTEREEEIEEFVFVASPRMLDRKEEMKVDGCDDGKEYEKIEEKVCGVERKREFEVGDCDERKRRKKDEEVVVL